MEKQEYNKQGEFIRVEDVCHEYCRKNQDGEVIETRQVLEHLTLHVERGQFISVLGRNGSGKSTLAKMLNALLIPTQGTVWIGDISTAWEDKQYEVRQMAGMIFQNPDNQLVSPVVEEDVGFGPENLGLPKEEIWERVEQALRSVDMWEYRKCSPNQLSGGQKQRVTIAGILAMKPSCIVADEPTSMLDPVGRSELVETLHRLNKEEGVTVIFITHNMEEVIASDYVYCMDAGKIVWEGTPKEIFSQDEAVEDIGLELPTVTRFATELRKQGMNIDRGILTAEELKQSLMKNEFQRKTIEEKEEKEQEERNQKEIKEKKHRIIMQLKEVGYQYYKNSDNKDAALQNITMNIYKGEFLGIIGETGSGKSTLLQHLNGLIKPKWGEIYFKGENIYHKNFKLSQLRFWVGVVFQYPEYQLFRDTVMEDVMFGPKNQVLSTEEAKKRAVWALEQVQLPRECWEKSPFVLSGGEKRKAALAGILAMKPEVLVLDEPAAALDPEGKKQILDLLKRLQQEEDMTIVMVSHNMEHMAEYADRIIAMKKGSIVLEGTPKQVFAHEEQIKNCGLKLPQITKIMRYLCNDNASAVQQCIRMEEAVEVWMDMERKNYAGGYHIRTIL